MARLSGHPPSQTLLLLGALSAFAEKASDEEQPTDQELACYDDLFKKGSKPASHLKALAKLVDTDIQNHCPEPLRNLISKAVKELRHQATEDTAEG